MKIKKNKIFNKPTLLLFLAIFMAIGTYLIINSRAATGAVYYIASSGSDSNNCTQVTPCLTFDKAYRVASPGDTILVSAGTYPQQNMTGPPKTAGPNIIIQPSPGATVTVGTLIVEGPSYVTIKDFKFVGRNTSVRVTNSNTSGGSKHVIFENLSNTGKIYAEGLVSDITFRNIEAGDVVDNQSQIKKYDQSYPASSAPTRILIENSTFHDYRISSAGVHSECLQIINSIDVTVRNSKLYNCSGTAALGVTNGPHVNLKVENNWLAIGTGQAYYSAQITKNITNLIFRYNTSPNSVIFSDTDPGGPYTIMGNYMGFNSSICGSGIVTNYNVFSGGTCGANDTLVSSLKFVDSANNDYHLAPNSEAINKGNPSNYPADDIDGGIRPSGSFPDAGAHEHGSTITTPPPTPPTPPPPSTKLPGDVNLDKTVNIDDLSILLSKWNTNYTPADFYKDNTIDISDLSILLINWGKKLTTTQPTPLGVGGSWTLKFNDEFEGTILNKTKWTPGWFGTGITGPVNDFETACYDQNLLTMPGDGYLHMQMITKTNTCKGKSRPYTGSLISSNPLDYVSGHVGFDFTYGYKEFRIYLPPTSSGSIANWPGVWANGQVWPNDGEDDVMEGLGGSACYHYHSTLGGPGNCASGNYSGWHTFGSDWQPGSVTYYYDGVQVGKITTGISNSPQYLIVQSTTSADSPTVVPADVKLDYVRVWQR